MRRRITYIFLVTAFCFATGFTLRTHKPKLVGYVYDKKTKEPIPGCFVQFKSTTYKTQTNFEGMFSFDSIPSGKQTMCIWIVGYDSLCTTKYLTTKKYFISANTVEIKVPKCEEWQVPKNGK